MRKVLFVATVVKGHIDVFHIPYLKMLKEEGWETTVVARNNYDDPSDCRIPYCDHYYDVPFERNPFKFQNKRAYFELKKIIKETQFDIIHCHTPVGGVITRLAGKKAVNSKIIYTAHGFHFFKGAPIKNWLLFYPVEKYLSKFTDIIITMNVEDYSIAKNKFYSKKIVNIPGIGIDMKRFVKFSEREISEIRNRNNLKENDFVLISVGELSNRKNQEQLILVAQNLKDKIPFLKVLIVGTGEYETNLRELVNEKKLENIVIFLGYRKDVADLMAISNIVVSTSKQEGLPVNLLEGLASRKPLVVTDCRGNRDLVEHNKNGFISPLFDVVTMSDNIIQIFNDKKLEKVFGNKSLEKSKKYSLDSVMEIMKKIYFT
ncbi:glycosyltransferase family 4 protein [Vagococcus fluvialis]|uniref:glycosyltransferase family 4 protein n=1 Tax=Vagococcus fluvialis TaxID=2738 RepID=UPI001A90097C|nr:glycosyltransferase family 4 protein [Vagococcus fluvialis]MBO0429801.1 glycosyltransferase family 4 protein [Vagococcus fluvialis]